MLFFPLGKAIALCTTILSFTNPSLANIAALFWTPGSLLNPLPIAPAVNNASNPVTAALPYSPFLISSSTVVTRSLVTKSAIAAPFSTLERVFNIFNFPNGSNNPNAKEPVVSKSLLAFLTNYPFAETQNGTSLGLSVYIVFILVWHDLLLNI